MVAAAARLSNPHPLDDLSPSEISQAAEYIREAYPNAHINFRVITLSEPPKAVLEPYLRTERSGFKSSAPAKPARMAYVQYYVNTPQDFREVHVDLDKRELLNKNVLKGVHSFSVSSDMEKIEKACIESPEVKEVIDELLLPEGSTVVAETWTYATDGENDMKNKIVMCYMYMRPGSHLDTNYYAYPLDFCVEMSGDGKVLNIIALPLGIDGKMKPAKGNLKPFDRKKIHTGSEYHPDIQTEKRTTVTPYNVVQPQGPSFRTQGQLLTWEKWRLRVGFNYREGMVLHDVSYDGRQLFYRLSLAEMFVPYGDSRSPYPRKAAFDLGNDGAGVNANNLKLGCDCLGHIKYFDGYHHTTSGDPIKLPNVICCHEQDDGILWKHMNTRTKNPVTTRSRVLVLQSIITVTNYEYIFAFYLNQAAEISYEVRATGILSTVPTGPSNAAQPYGTVVAPGVLAPYHQHLFCLRIDTALDGPRNSFATEETYPLPLGCPSGRNAKGVGYTTRQQFVEHEAALDVDIGAGRVFKVINEGVTNPVNGGPVGFKIVPHYSQMLLAHPTSHHAVRSEFAAHPFWVTRYADGERHPAGQHTMQSERGSGIATWLRNRPKKLGVRNEDIVVWHTFGATHNPRIEEWPVMPVEKMMVTLKPVNFFSRNPAVDVPISNQEQNQSVLVEDSRDGRCYKSKL
ncbi:amine oxidase [Lineolata rhizophorae]|uniref:Amine oxidase n=1 Tax=Lineolata rhizophorae TaxID=578093 RepID=A0A6A6P1V1_9PEZI|nr:amine oxidase [Lineolata rhizophorae]